jgi:hypothetical protein
MKGRFNYWLNSFGIFITAYASFSVMIYTIERLV